MNLLKRIDKDIQYLEQIKETLSIQIGSKNSIYLISEWLKQSRKHPESGVDYVKQKYLNFLIKN